MNTIDLLKEDLKKNGHSLEDFFTIIRKHYDTENAKPGMISRATLIGNVQLLINASGAKPRK